jgi:hypothetical protein
LPAAALLGAVVDVEVEVDADVDVVFAVGLGAESVLTVPLLTVVMGVLTMGLSVVVMRAVDAAEASAWGTISALEGDRIWRDVRVTRGPLACQLRQR